MPGFAPSELPAFDIEYRSHSHEESDGSASWTQRDPNETIKPVEVLVDEEKAQTKAEV